VKRLEDWDALEQGYSRLNHFSNPMGEFLSTYCGELIDDYKTKFGDRKKGLMAKWLL